MCKLNFKTNIFMRNLNLIIALFILMQSCQTYKAVNILEIKKGKTYEIHLKSGKSLDAVCKNVTDKNISVIINKNVVELPKSSIEKAKIKKTPILRLIGGLTLTTVGVIVLLNSYEGYPTPITVEQ